MPRPILGVSPGRLVLIGFLLLVAALVMGSFASWAVQPLAWAGVGLLILSYVLFFTGTGRSMERRWRGRIIEDDPPRRDGPLARLSRWLSRR